LVHPVESYWLFTTISQSDPRVDDALVVKESVDLLQGYPHVMGRSNSKMATLFNAELLCSVGIDGLF
jgi:hypothetical protein